MYCNCCTFRNLTKTCLKDWNDKDHFWLEIQYRYFYNDWLLYILFGLLPSFLLCTAQYF